MTASPPPHAKKKKKKVCVAESIGSAIQAADVVCSYHSRTIWSMTFCTQLKSSFAVIRLHYTCLFNYLIRESRSVSDQIQYRPNIYL